MPLPTVESMGSLEELEAVLRPYLEGRDSVSYVDISEECIVIRTDPEEIKAIMKVMGWLSFRFDSFARKFIRIDPVNESNRYKIKGILRHAVTRAIKSKGRKGDEYVEDLGCTIKEFRRYLQARFELGMTWENHGEWEADHIRPLSTFKLTDREQYLLASHWSNIRPVWASQHRARYK